MNDEIKNVLLGQTVRFKFGKIPATEEGMSITSRRASNMTEAKKLAADSYKGEWVGLYATDKVLKVENDTIYLESGYRAKVSEVTVIL